MGFTNLGLALAQSFIAAQLTVCPLPSQVPKVSIHFFPKPPVYINEAPAKALTAAMKNIPDSTAANHKNAVVMGLTEPKLIDGGTNVRLSTVSDDTGNICFAVSQVDMVLHYRATIFIARELSSLPCRLSVTQMHEEQHVALDHEVFRDYIPKIKMEILWYLRSQGMQGPFTQSEAPQKSKEMITGIHKAIQPMLEKMRKVRTQKQGAIDTIENYRAEGLKCPEENAQMQKVFAETLK